MDDGHLDGALCGWCIKIWYFLPNCGVSCLNITLAFGETHAHIHNIMTQEGLVDLIMVGNMLEFALAFGHKFLGAKPDVVEEMNVAMRRYRIFQSWFTQQHILEVGGQGLNASYVFNRSLIQFGGALCSYMKRWETKVALGISARQVKTIVLNHFRKEWQDLLGAFERLLNEDPSKCQWFSWNGPNFHILPRDKTQVWTEVEDWSEDPVYTDIPGLGHDEDVDEVGEEDPEEVHSTRKRPPMNNGTFSIKPFITIGDHQ